MDDHIQLVRVFGLRHPEMNLMNIDEFSILKKEKNGSFEIDK
jgi:hypothetical protein